MFSVQHLREMGVTRCWTCIERIGGAENAGPENEGPENAGPNCRA